MIEIKDVTFGKLKDLYLNYGINLFSLKEEISEIQDKKNKLLDSYKTYLTSKGITNRDVENDDAYKNLDDVAKKNFKRKQNDTIKEVEACNGKLEMLWLVEYLEILPHFTDANLEEYSIDELSEAYAELTRQCSNHFSKSGSSGNAVEKK